MTIQSLLARYEIIKPLAQGGFSNTYIAKDLQENKICVIKNLFLNTNDPSVLQEARRLFKIEAQTLKKLSANSHVPNVIDYFEENGQYYLIQEFIEGETLTQKLIPNQPWEEEPVLELCKDILQILEYIHSLGVIHRDIKPDNIIIRNEDQKLFLIDFGAVKEFNPQQSQVISQTIAVGTRGYMPLEQIRGKPRKSSDLYAVGIIAIQALTGIHPVDLEEDNNGEIIWEPYARVSPLFAEVLRRLVHPNAQERYQSATQILQILRPGTVATPKISAVQLSQVSPDHPKGLTHKNSYKVNQISLWLQSPMGKNVKFALLIGTIATVGVYFLGVKEKQDRVTQIEKTVQQLESFNNNYQYDDCIKEVKDPKTLAIGIAEDKRLEILVKCTIGKAEMLAEKQKFSEAVEILNQIPPNTRFETELSKKIDSWVKDLLTSASQTYSHKGDLSQALEILSSVPAKSNFKEDAESLAREWTAETERLQALLKKAELALGYESFQEVMEYAKEISNTTSSDYWLLQAKNLADKAAQGLSKASPAPHPSPEVLPEDGNSKNGVIEVPDILR
jgi:serine/threonine-protein kinase